MDWDTPGKRLRWAREQAGYGSIAEAARAKGFHKQNLGDHEADRRGISPDAAGAYAKAFRVHKGWLLFGDGSPQTGVPDADDSSELAPRMVPVIGEVRAGVWAEIPENERSEDVVAVDLPAYRRARLFALRVVGSSMDRYYKDGSTVIVCPADEAGVRDGDHVIVRRRRGVLYETTVKEIVVEEDGGISLYPRSDDPAYQTPYRLEMARDADDGPAIIGVVVGSFTPGRPRTGLLLDL